MARPFDRLMLAQRVCQSRTTRRLDDGEFRAFIAALCLAGQSPVRGELLLAQGEPLTAADVADEAGVGEAVAKAALSKLLRTGTLIREGETLLFANWERYNPRPRPSDSREAMRERKRRQRERERAARQAAQRLKGVSAPLAGDPDSPPTPPPTRRKRDVEAYAERLEAFTSRLYPAAFNGSGSVEDRKRATTAVRAAIARGKRSDEEIQAWIAATPKHSRFAGAREGVTS